MNRRRSHISRFIQVVICLTWLHACDTMENLKPDHLNFFVRYYGDEGNQQGIDMIVEEGERTVILLGNTTIPGTNNTRIFLVKADWEGNLIWKKKLGGPFDTAKDIEPANDGGYVILSQYIDDEGSNSVKLLKVNSNGDKQDSVLFSTRTADGQPRNARPETVTPNINGYVVTGTTDYEAISADPNPERISDIFHVRFSNNFVIDDTFSMFTHRSVEDIGYKTVLVDNKYFVFSSTRLQEAEQVGNTLNFYGYSYNGGDDANTGDQFWLGSAQTGSDKIIRAICPSFTPGYFLAGSFVDGPNIRDVYIGYTYIDNGTLYKAGGEQRISVPTVASRKIIPTSVCQAKVGRQGYLILSTEGEEGSENILLMKVGVADGHVQWSSVFGAGGRNRDTAGAVAELPDGRILVIGTVNLGVSNLKMAFFKLNSEGKFAN